MDVYVFLFQIVPERGEIVNICIYPGSKLEWYQRIDYHRRRRNVNSFKSSFCGLRERRIDIYKLNEALYPEVLFSICLLHMYVSMHVLSTHNAYAYVCKCF